MPWCPKCGYEYEDGYKECPDCGCTLADTRPASADDTEYDVPAYLATVRDDVEAGMLESKLNACGIPVVKKYREVGSWLTVFTGSTIYGISLYVPSRALEKAKEITSTENTDEYNFICEDTNTADSDVKADNADHDSDKTPERGGPLLFSPLMIWLIVLIGLIYLLFFR